MVKFLTSNIKKDFVLLSLVVLTIPFKLNYSNLFLIIAFIYSIFRIFYKREKFKFLNFYILFPLFFFIIVCISALTSKNIPDGLLEVNKNLLLVLITISLIVLTKKAINLNKLLFLFSISSVFSTAILLINNLIKSFNRESLEMLFFHNFTRIFDQHPVYFSLYLALSVFIVNDFYFKKLLIGKFRLLVFIIMSSILYLGLFFCASKIVMLLFIILNIVQFVILIKPLKFKLIIVSFFLLLIFISLKNDFVIDRFNDGLLINSSSFVPTNDISKAKIFSYQEKQQISDLELRILFIKIGLFHFIDDNKLIIGYGAGDVQDYLDYYYMIYGLAPNWYEGYNLHNQYLQILLTYGLFVFILFIIYLVISLKQSIKAKSILHIYFVIMVLITFIFESYLVRNKGILFFYFFNTLFLMDYYKKEQKQIS